jgi:hypothetical protein
LRPQRRVPWLRAKVSPHRVSGIRRIVRFSGIDNQVITGPTF